MNSISVCLDSINDIEDQMFLAECDVMLANDIWLNKMSEMVKYSGNSDSMIGYIQEADYGRRDTGGNKWLNKIRIFILRCIDKIIDAITNFLLKIKTRNTEYVRIPYKYEDLMEDINLVKSIDKELYQIFDNVESFASVDNVHKLTAIKEKLRNTHFAKNQRFLISDKDPDAHNKLNKYGIKPDQYMKLAKDLRDLNRALKDTKTRASKMVQKEWFKEPDSIDKPRVVVQELVFNIYTEMSKMMVKLMQSFSVSGVEKMNQEVVKKKIQAVKIGIIELRKIIDESVEYDIDDDDELEFFDETEKPFDDYLNKHKYDPKTNTIEVDGVRRNAGKIPSKKERNRINKFLRENNYDPKTETIETDITDKDGNNKRVAFNIGSRNNEFENEKGDPYINFNTKTMMRKPEKSNQSFKHEEGHFAQSEADPNFKTNYSTKFEKPVSTNKDELDSYLKDNPVNHRHHRDFELDADLYGMQHNPYAKSNGNDRLALKDRRKEYAKSIDEKRKEEETKADERVKDVLPRSIKNTQNNIDASLARIDKIKNNINSLNKMIETAMRTGLTDEDREEFKQLFWIDDNEEFNIERIRKEISKCESMTETLSQSIAKSKEKLAALEREGSNHPDVQRECNAIYDDAKRNIERYVKLIDSVIKSGDVREEYLNKHSSEAGSKARKLEGRQGKHKGKK